LNGKEELSSKSIPCDNKKSFGFFNEINEVYINNFSITIL